MARKKLTTEEFVERAKFVYGNKYDYSFAEYGGDKIKVKIICKEHGIFEQRADWHCKGFSGCKYCSKIPVRSTEQFICNAQSLHIDEHKNEPKYDYSLTEYINAKTKVKIICRKHGEFLMLPRQHISQKRKGGCQKCSSKSTSNEKIEMLLINNKIKYETEKRFPDCKDRKPLPFDFYLKDFNVCIEFDGIQHFEDRFFSKRLAQNPRGEVENIQKRDKIKTEYCNKKGIKLLRIKYTENIEKKINEFFNSFLLEKQIYVKVP